MKNYSKVQYQAMNPKDTLDGIKEKCEFAKMRGCACIEVPQWFVSYAKKNVSGSDMKVSTCVGLPGGESSTFAKYAEVKQAIANEVDEISIPVNMLLVKENRLNEAKNDFNEVMSMAKNKAKIKAILEIGELDHIRMKKVIDMLLELNVDAVVLSGVVNGKSIEKKYISEIKEQIKSVELIILGCIFSEAEAEEYIHCGADKVALSKV